MMRNSKTIASRIDNKTYSLLQDICNKENKTSSQIIHQLVMDYVKNYLDEGIKNNRLVGLVIKELIKKNDL